MLQTMEIDYKNIPIFIISFNRLSMLKQLIECLEKYGYTNLQIIDNCSTYLPLLEYYKNLKHKVYRLNKNYGHKVFWECGLFKEIIENQYYVVTDSDILPIEKCPNNFLELFYNILIKNPDFTKVGFSLKIDDIPNCNEQKEFIKSWEARFYENEYKYTFYEKQISIYDADIDTTFALYKPNFEFGKFGVGIRTGYPYQALHLPWYKNSQQELNEEDKYYSEHATIGVSNYSVNISNEELQKRVEEKYSFLEKLFSIKNKQGYKQIVVLGLKFKIKRRKVYTE